jgi:hypothetical protein
LLLEQMHATPHPEVCCCCAYALAASVQRLLLLLLLELWQHHAAALAVSIACQQAHLVLQLHQMPCHCCGWLCRLRHVLAELLFPAAAAAADLLLPLLLQGQAHRLRQHYRHDPLL